MAKTIAVIDCETDPFKQGRVPEPFLWGFYTPETGVLYFNNVNELMLYLEGKELRIYAHNGGKFDFHYMLDYIKDWQKITMINNRLAHWRCGDNEFVDSYCILPVPLSAYNKTDIDYAIFEKEEREKPENANLIADYLADDLRYTYELIDAFIQENGIHLTIASCAIKKLQKIEDIKIKDSGRVFFDDMSQFYYGGRVECFEKGIIENETIRCFDINSAYPYAMLHPHPIETYFTADARNPEIVGSNFYHLRAKSNGALPYRDADKRLSFPNDGQDRDFYCTGWELLAARETGSLSNVRHYSQRLFPVTRDFSNYVNRYYTIKVTSAKGSPENIFAKLFLNSAYGKFGANPSNYKDTYIIQPEDFNRALEKGFNIHGEIHGRLIISKEKPEEKWRHYNVATAASITGFVRAYLYRAMRSIERPLYCDTDSITFMGGDSLNCGDNLGQWKHEGDFNVVGIGGKKIYAMKNYKTGEEKIACKGARLSFEEIMSVCKGYIITKSSENPIYSIKKGKYFQQKSIAMT